MNRLRLERLEELERRSTTGRLDLEEVLECFLRPGFEVRAQSDEHVARLRRVVARLYAEPKDRIFCVLGRRPSDE